MKRLVLIAGLATLMSGCVFLPVPPYSASGRRVTQECTGLIQPGTDTLETVLLKFGEPDRVSPDERKIVFGSRTVVGGLFVIAPDDVGANGGDVSRFHFLTVSFDSHGVVTNREFSTLTDF